MKDLFLKREGFMYMMTAYAVVHTYKKKKSVKTSQSMLLASKLFFLINFAFLSVKGIYIFLYIRLCTKA